MTEDYGRPTASDESRIAQEGADARVAAWDPTETLIRLEAHLRNGKRVQFFHPCETFELLESLGDGDWDVIAFSDTLEGLFAATREAEAQGNPRDVPEATQSPTLSPTQEALGALKEVMEAAVSPASRGDGLREAAEQALVAITNANGRDWGELNAARRTLAAALSQSNNGVQGEAWRSIESCPRGVVLIGYDTRRGWSDQFYFDHSLDIEAITTEWTHWVYPPGETPENPDSGEVTENG